MKMSIYQLLWIVPVTFSSGVLFFAWWFSSDKPDGTIDHCEKCKTDLCESCDIQKRYDIVKADCKALEEANATLNKRCYQLNGIAERLQKKLDYQNRIIKVA